MVKKCFEVNLKDDLKIMASTIPIELRELLKRGEYLSMIPVGKKPNMNDYTFVDAGSFMGAVYRMLHGENRRGLILEINSIIDQFILALKNYNDTEFLPLIVDTLSRMKIGGLSNLMETYTEAPDTLSDLRVCISNIDLQLQRYKHLIRGYKAQTMMQPVMTEFKEEPLPGPSTTLAKEVTKAPPKLKAQGGDGNV